MGESWGAATTLLLVDRRTVAHATDAPLTRRPAHAATLLDCAVVDFELLGPFRVSSKGRRDAAAGQATRAPGAATPPRRELVTVDEAIEALWEEVPPPAARNAVQGHVAGLRKTLGADRIRTRGDGYVLVVGEDEVDLHRFEQLLTDASGRGPRERAELLGAALALFRGDPLQDFASRPSPRPRSAVSRSCGRSSTRS